MLSLAPAGAATRNTETQKLVSDYSRKEPLRSGIFSVLAVRGSDTLAQYNRRVRMVPASNVKLITTGLALKQLGPGWRFTTTLAYSGTITEGTLNGDLYIIGGGDPTTGARTVCSDPSVKTFASWRALLDAAGIKNISGCIIGDPRFFKRPSHGMSWQAEDLGYNYGAGPAGLYAAIAAARAGHKVTVFEKSDHNGGNFYTAAIPPTKGEITDFLVWQRVQCEKLGVEIKFNTPATAALIREGNYDKVIVATGSHPAAPPIPGMKESPIVTNAQEILDFLDLCK